MRRRHIDQARRHRPCGHRRDIRAMVVNRHRSDAQAGRIEGRPGAEIAGILQPHRISGIGETGGEQREAGLGRRRDQDGVGPRPHPALRRKIARQNLFQDGEPGGLIVKQAGGGDRARRPAQTAPPGIARKAVKRRRAGFKPPAGDPAGRRPGIGCRALPALRERGPFRMRRFPHRRRRLRKRLGDPRRGPRAHRDDPFRDEQLIGRRHRVARNVKCCGKPAAGRQLSARRQPPVADCSAQTPVDLLRQGDGAVARQGKTCGFHNWHFQKTKSGTFQEPVTWHISPARAKPHVTRRQDMHHDRDTDRNLRTAPAARPHPSAQACRDAKRRRLGRAGPGSSLPCRFHRRRAADGDPDDPRADRRDSLSPWRQGDAHRQAAGRKRSGLPHGDPARRAGFGAFGLSPFHELSLRHGPWHGTAGFGRGGKASSAHCFDRSPSAGALGRGPPDERQGRARHRGNRRRCGAHHHEAAGGAAGRRRGGLRLADLGRRDRYCQTGRGGAPRSGARRIRAKTRIARRFPGGARRGGTGGDKT
jgi:hypothetical protein